MMNTHAEDKVQPLRAARQRSNERFSLKYAWVTVFLVLAVVVISDFFSHGHHGGLHWESIPLFFFAFGVLSCLILVLAATLWGLLLGRSEDVDG